MNNELRNACNGKSASQGGLNVPEIKTMLTNILPQYANDIKKANRIELQAICQKYLLTNTKPVSISPPKKKTSIKLTKQSIITNVHKNLMKEIGPPYDMHNITEAIFLKCCDNLPHFTRLKLLERYNKLLELDLPFDESYHLFTSFEVPFYWDYDLRRTSTPSLTFWPLHNASFSSTDPSKYFEVVITELTPKIKKALRAITNSGRLSYDFEDINRIVNENLLDHELVIDSNPKLAEAIVNHTGGTLDLTTPLGLILSKSSSPKLKSDMIVWRTLSQPFEIGGTLAKVGDIGRVEGKVWSTSYDPISSYAFAMADETEDYPNVYMLKLLVPKGFTKGWFVENTYLDEAEHVLKEQFEYSIFGGSFQVINYYEKVVEIPDSAGNISPVFTRFYELVMDK